MSENQNPKTKVDLEVVRKNPKDYREYRVEKPPEESNGGSAMPHDNVAKSIVDHLFNAEYMKLLQITPIPKNLVFDIAYDVTQRAIMDKKRIAQHVPLSKIFFEAYLYAVRGADTQLQTGAIRLADSQINATSLDGEGNPTSL